MGFAESASGVASQASKQWSGIFADASARQKASEKSDAAEAAHVPVKAPVVAAPVAAATPEVVTAAAPGTAHKADDLTQVNGIGPKAAALLNEAGITTFTQLAALSTDQVRGILSKGGPRYRIIDPTPWPADRVACWSRFRPQASPYATMIWCRSKESARRWPQP